MPPTGRRKRLGGTIADNHIPFLSPKGRSHPIQTEIKKKKEKTNNIF